MYKEDYVRTKENDKGIGKGEGGFPRHPCADIHCPDRT